MTEALIGTVCGVIAVFGPYVAMAARTRRRNRRLIAHYMHDIGELHYAKDEGRA